MRQALSTSRPRPVRGETPAAHASGSGGGNTLLLLLGGAAAAGAGLAAANYASTMDTANTRTCSSGETDCGDGKCCDAGNGCCGIFQGREICCSVDFPHYCPSTQTCYRTMPSCDFRLCGGVLASAPGVMVGAVPAPGALLPGDPFVVQRRRGAGQAGLSAAVSGVVTTDGRRLARPASPVHVELLTGRWPAPRTSDQG